MKNNIRYAIISLGLIATVENAFSSTIPWFKDAVSFIGRPLSDTISIYRNDGLVIIDADKNYVSYSGEASTLNETQKQITGEVEKSHGFVISFSACESKSNAKLIEPISSATIKKYFENVNNLISELRELVSFFDKSPDYTKSTFGVSKSDQIFMGFKRKDELIIEIQLSQPPHTLTLIAAKKC